jgi:hypothetical protein
MWSEVFVVVVMTALMAVGCQTPIGVDRVGMNRRLPAD